MIWSKIGTQWIRCKSQLTIVMSMHSSGKVSGGTDPKGALVHIQKVEKPFCRTHSNRQHLW